MATKSSQVIFLKGKEKALKSLFSETFCYLAIGYDPENLGFENSQDSTIEQNGFLELDETLNEYNRIKMNVESTDIDEDTGKVLVKLSATLNPTNIVGSKINQMAIVDSSENTDEQTFFSATTFPVFNKTTNSSITFVIGMRL